MSLTIVNPPSGDDRYPVEPLSIVRYEIPDAFTILDEGGPVFDVILNRELADVEARQLPEYATPYGSKIRFVAGDNGGSAEVIAKWLEDLLKFSAKACAEANGLYEDLDGFVAEVNERVPASEPTAHPY